MINASFSYASDLCESGRFEIHLTTVGRRAFKTVLATFRVQQANAPLLADAATVKLREYPIWSEQPAELTLRALYRWTSDGLWTIPGTLRWGESTQ
jgi:hypothetical protein